MTTQLLTVEAIFEEGVLRPLQPLSLAAHQRVILSIQVQGGTESWPEDVAGIYQEISAEDRRLAEGMIRQAKETWPTWEEQP